MDPRLLGYYNRELQYIRETGQEFAKEFPKIAGRLGIESLECTDPYVERLLESFAFLTARVQLKIDAEFPRFAQHLAPHGVPALPRADALHGRGAIPAQPHRGCTGRRVQGSARLRAQELDRSRRTDRL